MTAVGTTSDLYVQDDAGNKQSMVAAPPPEAPAPVPTPVKVADPVVVKTRMADEGPDGQIRDTSSEALKPENDLGFRNLDDEAAAKKPKEETPAAPVTPQAPPEPKVYAGKFKSIEELEKGYAEAQAAMTKAFQEKADLERQAVARSVEPPKPVEKTPEQLAAERDQSNQIINDFVQNPKAFLDKHYQEATQRTQAALAAQSMTENWRKANPDLVEHEFYVASEASRLIQTDSELAKNPQALFERATANFRSVTGKLRSEGAKEALTQETRVTSLASSSTTPATTEQPAKAPMTADDAFAAHMAMLKAEERKSHRGLHR